jgi:LPXTG-motif cell wall-anchored protein
LFFAFVYAVIAKAAKSHTRAEGIAAMIKRLLSPLLIIGLTLNISGCTSGSGKDEAEVAQSNDEQFAEEGEGDFADESADTADSGDKAEKATDDAQVAESSDTAPPEDNADDLSIDDEGGDKVATEEAAPTDEIAEGTDAKSGDDELSLDDETLPDDVAATEQPPIAEEPSKDGDVAAAPETTDEPVFEEAPTDDTKVAENAAPTEEPAASPAEPPVLESNPPPVAESNFRPLLKVKDSAFKANDGTTMNRVYFARPGDTTKKISQKLYGSDRSRDLKKWNTFLAARGAKAGDKIYYASPTNGADGNMLTYYEEQNIPAQTYVSKPGDNIRRVSKDLLGFDSAWKEVWATNASVESKGDIPEGIELKYWPEGAAPIATQASNEPAPPTGGQLDETGAPTGAAPGVPTDLPPQGQTPDQMAAAGAAGGLPPPPPPPPDQFDNTQAPTNVAGADGTIPPPPLPDDVNAQAGAAGTVATQPDSMEPPPPPPMPAEPKPVVKKAAPVADVADEQAMDPDTTMALAVAGLLLMAAAALFVFIRKNRAKKLDMTQSTQI